MAHVRPGGRWWPRAAVLARNVNQCWFSVHYVDVLQAGNWKLLLDLEDPRHLVDGLPATVLHSLAKSSCKNYLGAFKCWKWQAVEYQLYVLIPCPRASCSAIPWNPSPSNPSPSNPSQQWRRCLQQASLSGQPGGHTANVSPASSEECSDEKDAQKDSSWHKKKRPFGKPLLSSGMPIDIRRFPEGRWALAFALMQDRDNCINDEVAHFPDQDWPAMKRGWRLDSQIGHHNLPCEYAGEVQYMAKANIPADSKHELFKAITKTKGGDSSLPQC